MKKGEILMCSYTLELTHEFTLFSKVNHSL